MPDSNQPRLATMDDFAAPSSATPSAAASAQPRMASMDDFSAPAPRSAQGSGPGQSLSFLDRFSGLLSSEEGKSIFRALASASGLGPELGDITRGVAQAGTGMAQLPGQLLKPPSTPEEAVIAATGGSQTLAAKRFLFDPQVEQAQRARELWKQPGLAKKVEALGHGAAAALPVVGPLAAGIGEQAGTGDVLGAAGQALALFAAPEAIKGIRGAPLEAIAKASPELAAKVAEAAGIDLKLAEPAAEPKPLAQFVQIPPDAFIDRVSPLGRQINRSAVESNRARIRSGDTASHAMISLDEDGNLKGSDGSHFALAAKEEGLPLIRVRVERDVPQRPSTPVEIGTPDELVGTQRPGEGPGTPLAGQTDVTSSDIRQVAEALKRQPAGDPASRIGFAKRVAERTTDAVGNALNSAKATTAALWDWYRRPAEWTDFKDSVGKWQGALQKSAFDTEKFATELTRKVPDPLAREAISNWIQADGNSDILRARARESSPSAARGYERALALTDAEKTIARNFSSYFDARLQEGAKAGLLEHVVENYVPQVWKRDDIPARRLTADVAGRDFQTRPRFARQRVFDNFYEGEQAGFTPKTKDIGALLGAYNRSFDRAVASRAMVRSWLDGTASDGRPIAALAGTPEAAGYRYVDSGAMRNWRGTDSAGSPVSGDVVIHPDYARQVKNILGTSALRESTVGQAFLKASGTLKSIMFSGSAFHQVQEGLHAIGHRVDLAHLTELDLDNPTQRSLVDHGLQVAAHDGLEQFSDSLEVPGLHRYTKWMFGEYIPKLKMSMALEALDRNTKRYSSMLSRDQLLELTANQANAAFGEQSYAMLGRNKTVQDVLRLIAIAPDFLEARGRFVGQALRPYGREQAFALGRLAAGLYVGSRLVNLALNNDGKTPIWQAMRLDKPFSVAVGGNEYRLRNVPEDILQMVHEPQQFFRNRLNPFTVGALITALTGMDWRGKKVSVVRQIVDYAKNVAPVMLRPLIEQGFQNGWWKVPFEFGGVHVRKDRGAGPGNTGLTAPPVAPRMATMKDFE